MQAPTLTTERLCLVPAGLDDVDTFHTVIADAGIRRYLCDDRILPRVDAEGMVWNSLRSFETDGMGLWLIHEVATPRPPIGFCMLRPPGEHPIPELLYAVLPRSSGRGLAVEAARAAVDYAFVTLRCAEMLAEMDEPDEASKRVAEKLGMTFLGTRPGRARTLLRYILQRADADGASFPSPASR